MKKIFKEFLNVKRNSYFEIFSIIIKSLRKFIFLRLKVFSSKLRLDWLALLNSMRVVRHKLTVYVITGLKKKYVK